MVKDLGKASDGAVADPMDVFLAGHETFSTCVLTIWNGKAPNVVDEGLVGLGDGVDLPKVVCPKKAKVVWEDG